MNEQKEIIQNRIAYFYLSKRGGDILSYMIQRCNLKDLPGAGLKNYHTTALINERTDHKRKADIKLAKTEVWLWQYGDAIEHGVIPGLFC